MKQKRFICLSTAVFWFLLIGQSAAHFGMVIPSDSMIMQTESRNVLLTFSFSHPFEGVGMDLAKPADCAVMMDGRKSSLLEGLKESRLMEKRAWITEYEIRRPGVYTFYMVPEPYWEPAEDCYIVHYTKTVVAAFGQEAGWDVPLGLKTEIVPLTRPFGLYAGNVFQGVVLRDRKPVPFAEVEVEFYNRDRKAAAPSDYMVTQVLKADPNGVFTYAVPRPGWWGFAALGISDQKMKYRGMDKDVEEGAVLWIEFHPWKEK